MSPLCAAVEWGVFGMARLIDAKAEESQVKTAFKYNPVIMGQFLRWIRMQDTVAAVPVSELLSLRDNLYEDNLITMRGLRDLNMLIAKYEGGKAHAVD